MNALIFILLIFIAINIFSNAKKKESLDKYHKVNNASFVAEVEEYARWSETIFKAYCSIAGIITALSELDNKVELHKCEDGFVMPKVIVNRRGHLGSRFREVFDCFKNKAAIDALKLQYHLPDDDAMRFDTLTRKLFRTQGAYTIHDNYYKSLYQILYLNVFLSLKSRQYNIGKSGIKESEIEEHQQIQQKIKSYPWLSGKFKRY